MTTEFAAENIGNDSNLGSQDPAKNIPLKLAVKVPVKPAVKIPVNQVGYDPKNRAVTLIQKGEKFSVTKVATRFTFTGTEKKATEMFKHQINCSHN